MFLLISCTFVAATATHQQPEDLLARRIEPVNSASWDLMAINPLGDLLEQIQQDQIQNFRLEIKAGGSKDWVLKGSFESYSEDKRDGAAEGKGFLKVIPVFDDDTAGPIYDAVTKDNHGMRLSVTLNAKERRFAIYVTNGDLYWNRWELIRVLRNGNAQPVRWCNFGNDEEQTTFTSLHFMLTLEVVEDLTSTHSYFGHGQYLFVHDIVVAYLQRLEIVVIVIDCGQLRLDIGFKINC